MNYSSTFGRCILWLGILLPINSWATDELQGPAFSGQQFDFFEERIRPVLVTHCYECHSGESGNAEGGLVVDSRPALLRGGDSGPAVKVGDSANSLLIEALRHRTLAMPPDQKLSDSIIADFQSWIQEGLADPRLGDAANEGDSPTPLPSVDPAAAASHWAFQAVVRPEIPLPASNDPHWVRNPIDAFVLEKLKEKSWRPAPEADRTTLLRRVTFDLTGLPPTADELDAFLRDESPLAYEKVVDRLLASPRYGERWGRHWLDLVRYADSNGADENHGFPVAWRYRDWVISELNKDPGYNQFLLEQLAGDLLTEETMDESRRRELLTATGMLVLGPKMLAEQDKAKMRIDIVDEQIDTVTRTVLGLTVACARCHDHKFDPISSQDYFALAGIFSSTRTMANEEFVSQWLEKPLPSSAIDSARKSHQQLIDGKRAERDALVSTAREAVVASNQGEIPAAEIEQHFSSEAKEAIAKANEQLAALEKSLPGYELVMAVEEGTPVDLPVHLRGNHLRTAENPTPRGTIACLTEVAAWNPVPAQSSGRLQLAEWFIRNDHPLTSRVAVNRVWMWHFGQPLMRSPSNFGFKGQTPSHPQLLDWLSWQWMQEGWSMKWLHRLILTSNTYRMTSAIETYQDQDPENVFLWRQNRRRLEIEPLRDAILAVGGGLDEQFTGPGVDVGAARRTVYASINRAALFEMLSTFDYVDPASHIEQRPVTTVPHQALFLMNHPLVHEQANRLANQLLEQYPDNAARIAALWLRLFQRQPSRVEQQTASRFIEQASQHFADAPQGAWASLIRSALSTSEFSYVE